MALKGTLTTVLLLLILPALASAQAGLAGDVTVRTNPQGAAITLSGEVVVSGVSPVRFQHVLIGTYDLEAKRPGYETYHSKVILDPTRPTEISVGLTKKTRLKAGLRSLVIPGWGQVYSGKKTKGFLLAGMVLGSAVGYLIADQDFDDKYDTYQARLQEYNEAATIDERQLLQPGLDHAHRRAYDAEDTKRVLAGLVIGIWGLNLLDAVLFFPEDRTDFSIKGLTVTPAADFESVGFTVSVKL